MKRGNVRRARFTLAILAVLMCTAPLSAQPAVDGQWSPIFSWGTAGGIEPIHMVMLPTGKVLFWQYTASSMGLWNTANGQFSASDFTIHNPFCAGFTLMSDGRLFLAGGHITDQNGDNKANIYNPFTNTWADNVPNMPNVPVGAPYGVGANGRWYPSVTLLSNGDLLVMSGSLNGNFSPDENPLPQVYQVATNSWRNLVTAYNQLPLYPRTFVAPDGRVVSVGDYNGATEYLNTSGTGSWTHVANALTNAGQNNLWYYAPAVMYDKGKVILIGGDDSPAPTSTAQIIDLTSPTPTWRYTGGTTTPPPTGSPYRMAQGRRQHNATLLADGKVFISGGSSLGGFNEPAGQISIAEIWDPETERFEQVAAASSTYRGYHTTALLLPDARVLVAGGNHDIPVGSGTQYVENRNGEIYSPPYLFAPNGSLAVRPTITSAPATATLGHTIFVATPNAASIADVNFIMPGSSTHSQDWSQRINRASFTQVAGGLAVTLPTSPNEMIPGYYMMFILNNSGVPSVANWVRAMLPIPGDFNNDNSVDAADYVMWRAGLSPTSSQAGYVEWQSNFADTGGGGGGSSSPAVPEPGAVILAITAIMSCVGVSRRRRRDSTA